MIGMIITGHGRFATGIREGLNLLLGKPEKFETELIESPTFDDIDEFYLTGSDDSMMDNEAGPDNVNDTLQKLKEKAAAIGGGSAAEEKSENKKISLDDLAKKAKSMK